MNLNLHNLEGAKMRLVSRRDTKGQWVTHDSLALNQHDNGEPMSLKLTEKVSSYSCGFGPCFSLPAFCFLVCPLAICFCYPLFTSIRCHYSKQATVPFPLVRSLTSPVSPDAMEHHTSGSPGNSVSWGPYQLSTIANSTGTTGIHWTITGCKWILSFCNKLGKNEPPHTHLIR